MSRLSKGVLVVVLALALAMAANLAWASNPNPQVLPTSKPYGMTYGEWGASMWQWELLPPVNQDPVSDPTGTCALLNQPESGCVFFLAGTFGGGPVVRNVIVPPGKAFFFPIFNWILTYPEDVPADYRNSEQQAEAWMRDMLNSVFNGVKKADLVCVVDGVAVKDPLIQRAQSPAFSLYMPPNCASVTDWYSLNNGHYAAGMHYPNVSDGYWVMLAPLGAGPHVIEIMYPADGSSVNVTYSLTVQ